MKLPPDLKGYGVSRSPSRPLTGAMQAVCLLAGGALMAVVVYTTTALILAL